MSDFKSRLADRVRARRDRAIADLGAIYDYHTDMIAAWTVASAEFAAGRGVLYPNRPVTNTPVTAADLLARTHNYLAVRHTQATFLSVLGAFEEYLADLLRIWLTAYPRSMGENQVKVRTIVDLPDKDAILAAIVDQELRAVTFDKPAEWFDYLASRTKVRCTTADIAIFTEAKAGRDVIAHNAGLVNRTYLFKAGSLARFNVGEKLDVPEPYHRDVWATVRRLSDEAGTGLAAAAG